MKSSLVGVIAIMWGASLIITFVITRNNFEYAPIQCKSPIDPRLEIIVEGDNLDTTWVYVRNVER